MALKVTAVDSTAWITNPKFDLVVVLSNGKVIGMKAGDGPGYWRRATMLLASIGIIIDDKDWPEIVQKYLKTYLTSTLHQNTPLPEEIL